MAQHLAHWHSFHVAYTSLSAFKCVTRKIHAVCFTFKRKIFLSVSSVFTYQIRIIDFFHGNPYLLTNNYCIQITSVNLTPDSYVYTVHLCSGVIKPGLTKPPVLKLNVCKLTK